MKSGKVVLDPDGGHQFSIHHTEDVDLVNVLKPPSSRRHPEPFAAMRARTSKPGDYPIALGDQLDKLRLEVRKRTPKRADPPLCDLRKLASRDLIQNIEIALLDDLTHQPQDQQLVLLSRHQDPLGSSSTKGSQIRLPTRTHEPLGSDRLCRSSIFWSDLAISPPAGGRPGHVDFHERPAPARLAVAGRRASALTYRRAGAGASRVVAAAATNDEAGRVMLLTRAESCSCSARRWGLNWQGL
jgi:hypothetical protein